MNSTKRSVSSIVRMNELVSDLLDCSKRERAFSACDWKCCRDNRARREDGQRKTGVPAYRYHASPRGIDHRMVRCQPSGTSCGQRCSECLRGGFSRVGPGRRSPHREGQPACELRSGITGLEFRRRFRTPYSSPFSPTANPMALGWDLPSRRG